MSRARKGGETGLNGQHYDGGQWLPGSVETVKGAQGTGSKRQPKARKEEYEPYKWDYAPAVGMRAIFSLIGGCGNLDRVTGTMTRFEPGINYYGETVGTHTVDELIARWNSGERWVAL